MTDIFTGRAYSQLLIDKAVEEGGKRIIRGVATTPTTDRMGDVVNPLGAKFDKVVAWLWQHKHDQPWGWVRFGKPTKDGIPFEAECAQTDEPGELKDFLDKCWQQVKLKLVRYVSIGFRALKWAWIGDYDGIEFQEIEIYELSAVTIPANPDAVINEISAAKGAAQAALVKAFDTSAPAAVRPERDFKAAADALVAALPDFSEEAEAASGQSSAEPEKPASRGHIVRLAETARVGAPFVINRIHPPA